MGDSKSHRNRVICGDARVPAGWVVIGICRSEACGDEALNALVIKRPGRLEVVWAESPVPDGWERVRRTRSESLPGPGENAWVIERRDDG
jgi:hypothetical protein